MIIHYQAYLSLKQSENYRTPVRNELINNILLAELANYYTTRGAQMFQWFQMINEHIYSICIFFIIQCVKARAIPCLHQPPTRGDKTVSVAQGGTATPRTTKQLLPPDSVFKIAIYIYI